MNELTPTATAVAGARSLLAAVDHAARERLSAEARLALVADVVALGRQVEALRAVLVAEADQARAAETVRGASIKTLLAVSSQITAGEAASWVYSGREITAHPRVQQATLTGEVSVTQARSIDRVLGELPATLSAEQRDHAEQILLDKAHLVDAKDLAQQTRSVLEEVAPEVDAVEDELSRLDAQRTQAWAARSLVFTPDGRGSVLFRGQLPTLEGEAFKRLVDAHTMSNRRAREHAADQHDRTSARTFEQRTADGLITLITHHAPDPAAGPVEVTDSHTAAGRPTVIPSGRTPLTKPTLVVTLSYDHLLDRVEQAGLLAGGEQITAGELRRLACDAHLLPIVLGTASQPLDVGREQRLVTPSIRKALNTRDNGCTFPGCRIPPTGCEAHHIIPWWAGGNTALDNLVLLCPHHHSTIEPLRFHDPSRPANRWTVHIGEDGHPAFTPPTPGGPDPTGLLSIQTRPPAQGPTHEGSTMTTPTQTSGLSYLLEAPTGPNTPEPAHDVLLDRRIAPRTGVVRSAMGGHRTRRTTR